MSRHAVGNHASSSTAMRFGAAIALPGWYLFALFSPFSVSGSYVGMALVLVGTTLVLPQFWRDIRHEPVFWLSAALVTYLFVRSMLAFTEFPQLIDAKNPSWTDLLQAMPLLAIPMGWWLYLRPRHIRYVLATGLAGIFVGIFYAGDWSQLLNWRMADANTWRVAAGYQPNFLGLMSAAALFVVGSWLMLQTDSSRTHLRWLVGLPLLAVLAILFYSSQSRAAWLGFLPALIALIGWVLWQVRSEVSLQRGLGVLLAIVGFLAVTVGVSLWVDGGTIGLNRITSESSTAWLMLSGEFHAAASEADATGWRLGTWFSGLDAASSRPWFGWGPGAIEVIPDAGYTDRTLSHFHNLYLEILVGFGLVGLMLSATCAWLLVRAAVAASRHQLWSPAMAGGLLAVSLLTAVALFFMIRIGQSEGRALLRIIEAFFVLAVFRVAAFRKTSDASTWPPKSDRLRGYVLKARNRNALTPLRSPLQKPSGPGHSCKQRHDPDENRLPRWPIRDR